MNSGAGIDKRMRIGEADCCFEIGRAVSGSDGEDVFQARLASTFDDSAAVVIELCVVEMTVGIDEVQEASLF
jgi:hypothetical protein